MRRKCRSADLQKNFAKKVSDLPTSIIFMTCQFPIVFGAICGKGQPHGTKGTFICAGTKSYSAVDRQGFAYQLESRCSHNHAHSEKFWKSPRIDPEKKTSGFVINRQVVTAGALCGMKYQVITKFLVLAGLHKIGAPSYKKIMEKISKASETISRQSFFEAGCFV